MKILTDKGYTYQKHLSTGGEGEVHLIKSVDKQFVAKIFTKLDKSSISVLNDIQRMNISGIPKIHEIFDFEDKTVIIRDYIEGTTLYDEIYKNECLSLKRAKNIITKICEILSKLHSSKPKPIIYRDLKPENIIITPKGDVKLIDFGIARYYKIESTRDTVLAGTRGYTAPEVMAGMQSDIRSDVYSAGLLFYEMITGKNLLIPPFQIRPVKESSEYLPEYLDDIIEKATDFNQTNRYKTVEEFINAIEYPEIKKKRLNISSKLIIGIAIGFVVFIVIGTTFYLLSKRDLAVKNTLVPTDDIVNTITGNNTENIVDTIASNGTDESEVIDKAQYEVILELDFEDKSDASWFEIAGDNADSIVAEDCIDNGIFTLKGQVVLKQAIQMGKFVHIKATSPDFDKTGSMFMLDLTSSSWSMNSELQMFRFYFENNRPLSFGVNKHTEYASVSQIETAMMMRSNMTVDIIVWLNDEDNSIRYIICDSVDKSDICLMGVTLDDSLISETWMINIELDTGVWNGAVTVEELYTDIDFLNVISGSFTAYLDENIPSYALRKDSIEKFITNSVPKMSELNYMKYD